MNKLTCIDHWTLKSEQKECEIVFKTSRQRIWLSYCKIDGGMSKFSENEMFIYIYTHA